MGGILASIFKGLAIYFDDIGRLVATAGGAGAILEYLVIVLAVVNVFKGPIVLIGLTLWRHKWGMISDEVAKTGAFLAGAYTVFDWTDWSFTVPRGIAAVLLGGLFVQFYRLLLAKLAAQPGST